MHLISAYMRFVLPTLLLGLLVTIGLVVRTCERPKPIQKKVFTIGRNMTWGGTDLRGKEKNMVGFTNDLIRAIARETKLQARIINASNQLLLDNLEDREYDGVFSSLNPTKQLEQTYLFSKPFYQIGPVLIVREESPYQSLKDMDGKTIGMVGVSSQLYQLPNGGTFILTPFETELEALDDLDDGHIDGVILDDIKAYTYTRGFFLERLRVATPPLTENGLRLIARNDPAGTLLINSFDEGLRKLRESQEYFRLMGKWDLINPENPPTGECLIEEEDEP